MWDDPNQQPAPQDPRREQGSYGQSSGYGQPPNDPYAVNQPGYGPDRSAQSGYDPSQAGGGWYGNGPTDPGYGQQPPAYPPEPPQYPSGRPPRWPAQDQAGGAYAPSAGYGQQPAYTPPAQQRVAERAVEKPRHPAGHALPHLPIAHVILVAGIVAMGFAISQPWGLTAAGGQIFVKDFASVQLNHGTGVDTSAYAVRAATAIVIAAAVLSAVLILFNTVVTLINKIIGVVGLSGCATMLFFPVLWGAATLLFVVLLAAAGFAGLGSLSNLPIVQSHGISTAQVHQHALGFYLWCGGAIAVFVGMLGQLVLRRR